MNSDQSTTSFLGIISRIFWMMIGPMVLTALAITIVRNGTGWFTPSDFTYLALLGVLLLARWGEFLGGNPQTASGEPASPRDLMRYAVAAAGVGLGVWVLANLLGNHWLAG